MSLNKFSFRVLFCFAFFLCKNYVKRENVCVDVVWSHFCWLLLVCKEKEEEKLVMRVMLGALTVIYNEWHREIIARR